MSVEVYANVDHLKELRWRRNLHCWLGTRSEVRARQPSTDGIETEGFVTDLAVKTTAMRVRVTRKLADCLDGVDLSRCGEGDVIELPEPEARLIVAEQWAMPARRASDREAVAADRRSSDLYQRLRDKQEQIEQERRRLQRRATDRPQPGTPHAA